MKLFAIPYQIAVLAGTTLTVVAGGPFDLSRTTIDGGGAMRSTSADGVLELSGTIGQPNAGVLTGGDFSLTSGFWFETPPGDCNDDGLTDLLELELFLDCASGPSGPLVAGPCRCFDLDRSGHVDSLDFAAYQTAFAQ